MKLFITLNNLNSLVKPTCLKGSGCNSPFLAAKLDTGASRAVSRPPPRCAIGWAATYFALAAHEDGSPGDSGFLGTKIVVWSWKHCEKIKHGDIPSGYLTVRHGKSPFLSSVNHLFLWAIFHGNVKKPEGNGICGWFKADASIELEYNGIYAPKWWPPQQQECIEGES